MRVLALRVPIKADPFRAKMKEVRDRTGDMLRYINISMPNLESVCQSHVSVPKIELLSERLCFVH